MEGEAVVPQIGSVRPDVNVRLFDQRRQYNLTARLQYLEPAPYHETLSCYIYEGDKERAMSKLYGEPMNKPPPEAPRQPWQQEFAEEYGNFACHAAAPIDGLVAPNFGFDGPSNDRSRIERYLLRHYKLVSTKPIVGGILATTWAWDSGPGKMNYEIEIDFSQAHEWMPVRVQATGKGDLGTMVFVNRVEWRKHGRHLLPYRMRFGTRQGGSRPAKTGKVIKWSSHTEAAYLCRWLIDDQLTAEITEAANPLIALLDHFQVPYAVMVGKDDYLPVEYPTPPGLYD